MAKKTKESPGLIAVNRRASHDYTLIERFEAGLVLQGWEVKGIRAGQVSLSESYVVLKRGEAWLLGAQITPLYTASTHVRADPTKTRKCLLNKRELKKLIGATERQGFTLVALRLYWKDNKVKCEIALAKGKKEYDKREADKQRDWQREKARIMSKR